ncbi:M4 family metallopeptidase [Longispora urticae]
MNRSLAAGGAALLLAGLAVGTAAMAQAAPDIPSRADAVARADSALAGHRSAALASTADAFSVYRTIVDPTGASHVRYTRTHQGLRVYGGDLVVHNGPGGGFAGVSNALAAPLTLSTTPAVPAASAERAAAAGFRGRVTTVGASELIVDASGERARLAWETVVRGWAPDGQTPSVSHVLTDAATGARIGAFDEIEHAAGTGKGVYVGTVSVDTTGSGSSYQLKDPVRGNGYTCDMARGTGSCSTYTDADNAWGDGNPATSQSAAVDAHYGAAVTYDYFKSVHGRNGIFGDGRGVPSRVHYGNAYKNAFWDGSQMTYGDGAGNTHPFTELDISGHEMAHGVTENVVSGGLTYSGESGGLNEATSDIFGTMVEFYAANSSDTPDYLIGEKIDYFGNGRPLRYMDDPSKDGNSDKCWSTGTGGKDVHYSSGVANHFFYLLAVGSGSSQWGNSPTCDSSTLTGIGNAKAEKIWFRALDVYFTSTTKYVASGTNDARNYTLTAAKDLYGNCSAEYQAVQKAWKAVNVAGEDTTCTNTPGPTSSPTVGPTSSPTATPTSTPSCLPVTNATDVQIPDAGAAVDSTVTVTGCVRNASASTKVEVHVKHTWRGDLNIDLVAPDGTVYSLKKAELTDSAANVDTTYTVDASAEAAGGGWKLRAQDAFGYDTGYIDTWTLTV